MKLWMPEGLTSFVGAVEAQKKALLMFDYDGTLAPFVEERFKAVPYPGVRERLEKLLRIPHCRVVFVTGRNASELPELLGLTRNVEVWGGHGSERLLPDGSLTVSAVPDSAQKGFEQALAVAASHVSADQIEQKRLSLAVHVRGLGEAAAASILLDLDMDWEPIADEYGLEIHPFNGGLELRIPGFHKGRAVAELLGETPADVPVVYMGDDTTDEDAFKELGARGFSVLVSSSERPSHASWHLVPPHDLITSLDAILAALSR